MFIDISRPVHAGMAIYPGNPDVSIEKIQAAAGDQYGLSSISLGSHTGTHIDTPLHIHADAVGLEAYAIEQMIGFAEVVEVSPTSGVITAQDIPNTTASRILFKTANSEKDRDEFSSDFIALDESAAQELVRRKVELAGIDALSIKKKGVKDRVHAILLDAHCVILEGLWLHDVAPGAYELMCVPLYIPGIDGVPVRALLAPMKKEQ